MVKGQRQVQQRGQGVLEYILLMVVVLGIGKLISAQLTEMGYIKAVTIEPWARLDGMIQCGTWTPCGINTPQPGAHANTRERILSLDPNTAP